MNKWCEHISGRHLKFVGESGNSYETSQCDVWKFCPICGARRPEETKKLWEVLSSACPRIADRDLFESQAKAALEWVEKVVDEVPNCDCSNVRCKAGCLNLYVLKDHLRSRAGIGE